MNVGLKVGLQNWQEILDQYKPEFVEVWFRIDWTEQYRDLFIYLQEKKIQFGLHFWGVLPGEIEANLAYPHEHIAEQAAELMSQNLSIAKEVGAHYVNIHPGGLRVKKLDLDNGRVGIADLPEIDNETALSTLQTYLPPLRAQAEAASVLLLLETLPLNDPSTFYSDRQETVAVKALQPEILAQLTELGYLITNDFSHTAMGWEFENLAQTWKKLLAFTQKTAAQTKLLHINTIRPPFNNTDSHDGILPEDFVGEVFPSREQLKELLQIFKQRDDVWLIPEPKIEAMGANYLELKKMVAEL